jgi:hypothetical protein
LSIEALEAAGTAQAGDLAMLVARDHRRFVCSDRGRICGLIGVVRQMTRSAALGK